MSSASQDTKLEELDFPTIQDTKYNYRKWRKLLKKESPTNLREASKCFSEEISDALLAGAVIKEGNKSEIDRIVGLNKHNNELSANRVRNRLFSALEFLPITTASLVCGWIPEINVYNKEYYMKNIRKSMGFYHPTEKYIDIAGDYSETSYNWARNNDYKEKPDWSTTIHELGHAIHSMNGIRMREPETDFRNNAGFEIGLNTEFELLDWQKKIFWDGVKSYILVMNDVYPTLRDSDYSKKNIEEVYAISFEAWITSPDYLLERQPKMWSAYNKLV